nr:ParB N-terminal domain-containing protein [Desulfofundulus thermobenzoicus]
MVSPDEIQADPRQPRRNFSREGLLELAASIARVGLIEPLVVEENAGSGKRYIVIAGERRHRAIMLGRELWPDNPHFREARCLVFPPLPDEIRAAFQLEENLKRSGLNPYEVASGLHRARLAMAGCGRRPAPAWDEVLTILGIFPGKETRKWLR